MILCFREKKKKVGIKKKEMHVKKDGFLSFKKVFKKEG